MPAMTDTKIYDLNSAAVTEAKIELAAACRWAARLNFQTGVCNHFSVTVPGHPDLMLINPEGYLWSEVKVSDLVVATHAGEIVSTNNRHSVERTAFCIHAPVHRLHPHAGALLHTHMCYTTAICMRKNGVVSPSYISAISFYDRIAYDRGFDGPAMTPAEGERLAGLIGDNFVLMMENHGPLVLGSSISEAFLRLVYLEETCRMQLIAENGGHELSTIPARFIDAIPRNVPKFKGYARGFMDAVIRTLKREEPEFLS